VFAAEASPIPNTNMTTLQEFQQAAQENRAALENLSEVFNPTRDPNEAQDAEFETVPAEPQEKEMNDSSNY
jgi:hypothetical protein